MPERNIPHGHGLSHKKGISDGLLERNSFADDLPNGHEESYRRGRAEGVELRQAIAHRVRPEPDMP